MLQLKTLWQDESGVVLSAEVVMLGTLGVLGAVVGLSAASTAVDAELKEVAGAIRSFDQSYGYLGHQSCRAWTAGSYYRQQDVSKSLADLCANGEADVTAIEERVDTQRARHREKSEHPLLDPQERGPAVPNQIPVPQLDRERDLRSAPDRDTPEPRKMPRKNRKPDRADD